MMEGMELLPEGQDHPAGALGGEEGVERGGMMESYTLTELVGEVDEELLLITACNTSIRGTC